MKPLSIIICILAIAWLFLAPDVCRAEQPPSPYMTVNEFLDLHPEQMRVMDEFQQLVAAPGTAIHHSVQQQPVKIAFVYPGLQVSDYWMRSLKSFRNRMDEVGIKYQLSEYFSKPVVDTRLQQMQLKEALKSDPDYLVFTLDAMQHRHLLSRLITKGRPKIILQNITTPLRMWEGKQPFLYVGFDHIIGSRILADYFLSKTHNGQYGLLFFGPGYVSDMRGKTFARFMEQGQGPSLAAAYFTDGNQEKARKATLAILEEHDIAFLYACSTSVALGAIDALRETGKTDQVMINGWGGGSAELEAILAGELDVTVMRMNDDNGVAMAEAIRLDAEGKPELVPTIYSGDFVLVEKGISPLDIEQLKARAFRYSGR
ncbi:substrate-binding domain-containing protein [Desulfovibrio ferrophilus]|uniref:Autoinducer 2-binding periplasmic protein LuxP n=1 Tax=Desulfovibrio ferrophilus TaxID=241368 RepID=A0A2Z6B1H4_9BACT|nr:substrate-binding domain-containing protein [Desulfovibrio ferrophilus]BBD09377.1 autoinducer 2-binding periplasmic protein LuxP [Desulfovibrio ferrophilus]